VSNCILVNNKGTTLAKDACIYRGADTHSDHFLLTAKLAVPKKTEKTPYKTKGGRTILGALTERRGSNFI
jgi:hypothetical protein